jgi:hypothetical protein
MRDTGEHDFIKKSTTIPIQESDESKGACTKVAVNSMCIDMDKL